MVRPPGGEADRRMVRGDKKKESSRKVSIQIKLGCIHLNGDCIVQLF